MTVLHKEPYTTSVSLRWAGGRFLHGGEMPTYPRFIPAPQLITNGGKIQYEESVGEFFIMSNQERIKARIARDKARKAAKRAAAVEQYGRIESVITNQNLHRSLMKRRKGVEWKGTVQAYVAHAIVKIKRAKDDILRGRINIDQHIEQMTLYERGKKRHVHMVRIDSRVIQGALCDACITPLMLPGIIYDNPASTKGRGVSYARERLEKHLRKQIKKSGADFHVLTFDFKGFFDSIPHALCLETIRKMGIDEKLQRLIMHFIKMYHKKALEAISDAEERKAQSYLLDENKGRGCTLGSQISQNMAVCTPNRLDHYIKDGQGIKVYERYMDDGIITHGRSEVLKSALEDITQMCAVLGFSINAKKTNIVRVCKQTFEFLKIRYTVTPTGKIIKRIAKGGIVRMRRKLSKFRRLVARGAITKTDVEASFNSWYGYAKRIAQTYRTRKEMKKRYYALFGFNKWRKKGAAA